MQTALLRCLRCPYCGGDLHTVLTAQGVGAPAYGVLTCDCGQYPVVDDIPILKKGPIGAAGQTADHIIALIQAGQYQEALLAMILVPAPAPAFSRFLPSGLGMWRLTRLLQQRASQAWREQFVACLRDRGEQMTACEFFDLQLRQSRRWGNAYDYFAFRFSQPRHLVGLALATLLQHPQRPVLDLACGAGHLTRSLVSQAHGQQVIGVDHTFFMLHIAHHWIAPEAAYVCCEADAALPFPDGAFSTIFCSDAWHYFVNKALVMREVKRLTQEDGCLLVASIRNSHVQHQHACLPCSPEGLAMLFAGMAHCILSDSDLLARYLQKQGPALAHAPDLRRLAHAPLLSGVASHRPEVLQNYGPFEDWPHAVGRLTLNPLFVAQPPDSLGNVSLCRMLPTDFYAEENAECTQYLPEVASCNVQGLADLAQAKRTPAVERLIDQYVVLGLPERYW